MGGPGLLRKGTKDMPELPRAEQAARFLKDNWDVLDERARVLEEDVD